jgi:hypothetical protein
VVSAIALSVVVLRSRRDSRGSIPAKAADETVLRAPGAADRVPFDLGFDSFKRLRIRISSSLETHGFKRPLFRHFSRPGNARPHPTN